VLQAGKDLTFRLRKHTRPEAGRIPEEYENVRVAAYFGKRLVAENAGD
jgi:hypothetical protein